MKAYPSYKLTRQTIRIYNEFGEKFCSGHKWLWITLRNQFLQSDAAAWSLLLSLVTRDIVQKYLGRYIYLQNTLIVNRVLGGRSVDGKMFAKLVRAFSINFISQRLVKSFEVGSRLETLLIMNTHHTSKLWKYLRCRCHQFSF